ncbi:MAG: hypothetical protein MUF33_09365 [Candidatus Nanopelagicales bacterium]|nr:hypothetical protein [Candidatus Nanopelagicales bacterium]MCU0294938.1 hypothetical protein [Candidatus Nanopelagicales bacterium]MCU0298712.1 hypothetical protein [Candidatus Nanopelagicales bacterium]
MLTGLLYVAVIGMWAVVLLPRWLGTSDRYRDARSTQRFRRSLRAVSVRRHRSHDMAAEPGSSASRVDTAPADAAIDAHLDHGIDPFVGMPEDKHRRRARAEQARAQATAAAAVRRRRVLIVLGAATSLSLIAAVVGFLPFTLAVVCAAALGGYLYLLRSQSRIRARAAADRRRSAGTAKTATATSGAEQTWDPVEAPIPSYMRAAKATAIPREIDSTKNGPWTAERMLEQAAALRAGEDAEAELGLDEYAYPEYQHARAVNE